MINTDTLQNTETLKNECQKNNGQVCPETVILLSKYSPFPSPDSLPNIHSQTACRFSVLSAATSDKN
jgi:hypothetical protein